MITSNFKEITLVSLGYLTEVMINIDCKTNKAIRIYAYTSDVKNGNFSPKWQWKEGMNPLFSHLICDNPHKIYVGMKRNGWVESDVD